MKECVYGWYPSAAELSKSRHQDIGRDSSHVDCSHHQLHPSTNQRPTTTTSVDFYHVNTCSSSSSSRKLAQQPSDAAATVIDSAAAPATESESAPAAATTVVPSASNTCSSEIQHQHHHHQQQQQWAVPSSVRRGKSKKLWADRLPETTCTYYPSSSGFVSAAQSHHPQVSFPCSKQQLVHCEYRQPLSGRAQTLEPPITPHQKLERRHVSDVDVASATVSRATTPAGHSEHNRTGDVDGMPAARSVASQRQQQQEPSLLEDVGDSTAADMVDTACAASCHRRPFSAVNATGVGRTSHSVESSLTARRAVQSAGLCRRTSPTKDVWTAAGPTVEQLLQQEQLEFGNGVRWRFRHSPKAAAVSSKAINSQKTETLGVDFPLNYDEQLKKHGWKMEIPGDPLNFKRPCLAKRRPTSVTCAIPPVAPFAPTERAASSETFFYSTMHRQPLSFTVHPDFASEVLVARRLQLQKRASSASASAATGPKNNSIKTTDFRYTDFSFVY